MKYMGSKNRIAKHILPIILSERKNNQWYVEPFVGGGNSIDKVSGKRIGGDSNKYVIQALISIRDYIDELPKDCSEFTEFDYKNLKKSNYKHKGYAGFVFSYGGKWMGGWRRDSAGKRDYVKEAYNNALKQNEKIYGCKFINCNYYDLDIPECSLIYCDPPYLNSTSYGSSKFNHDLFWKWCRYMSKRGNDVFISEYNAPSDFECIFSMEICSSLTKNTGNKFGNEKLFKYKK